MSTNHNHSSGAALPLSDGGVATVQTKFSQDVAIDPVSGKPRSEVTALRAELVVLDRGTTRHVVEVLPFLDGSGVEIRVDGQHYKEISWRAAS